MFSQRALGKSAVKSREDGAAIASTQDPVHNALHARATRGPTSLRSASHLLQNLRPTMQGWKYVTLQPQEEPIHCDVVSARDQYQKGRFRECGSAEFSDIPSDKGPQSLDLGFGHPQ